MLLFLCSLLWQCFCSITRHFERFIISWVILGRNELKFDGERSKFVWILKSCISFLVLVIELFSFNNSMLALRDALVSSKYVSHLQILLGFEKNSTQLHSVGAGRKIIVQGVQRLENLQGMVFNYIEVDNNILNVISMTPLG